MTKIEGLINKFDDYESLKTTVVLKASRILLGLNLKEAGKQFGVSAVGYCKWENGEVSIKASNLTLIKAFYRHHGIIFDVSDDANLVVSTNERYLDLMTNKGGVITPMTEILEKYLDGKVLNEK